MCGIFGISFANDFDVNSYPIKKILNLLYKLSSTRGREASGLSFNLGGNIINLKSQEPADVFIKSKKYNDVVNLLIKEYSQKNDNCTILAHSRLVTNGTGALNINNQPVYRNGISVVHNGIITNDEKLWAALNDNPKSNLDTEVLAVMIASQLDKGVGIIDAINEVGKKIQGSASLAITQLGEDELILYSNTGSLYYFRYENNLVIYASEEYILQKLIKKYFSLSQKEIKINQVDINAAKLFKFKEKSLKNKNYTYQDRSGLDYPNFYEIKRCRKCILPYTFPYIKFNGEGICNYCSNYKKISLKKMQELKGTIERIRKQDGNNCLVGISGGRDSCYGLHVIKNELGLKPLAFTYDWGLVTDEARRNTAKICGKLGIEHIIVSADIAKKRNNVRKNIMAWIKKPTLAMVPIFMAGDKLFYYYAHKLRKQTGIPIFIFCAGNKLETTDFKVGFIGVRSGENTGVLTSLSKLNKLKLALSYLKEIFKNPRYINDSAIDTFKAFYCSYFLRDDYLYLYDYIPWNEDEINRVIQGDYDWKGADDTNSTWRTGDGTSAFYNYIYYVVAGFTENDTFRSNQIREGIITRDEAMNKVEKENQPRWKSMQEYANTIGFNLNDAITSIHKMRKLYEN